MSASAAVVVDLESYRRARRASAAPAPRPMLRPSMALAPAPRVVPVLVWWVPVWPVA